MTGRVDLTVVLRYDTEEPTNRSAVATIEGIDGRPVLVVSDLIRVDELALGHAAAMLLTEATQPAPGAFPDFLLDADTDRDQP